MQNFPDVAESNIAHHGDRTIDRPTAPEFTTPPPYRPSGGRHRPSDPIDYVPSEPPPPLPQHSPPPTLDFNAKAFSIDAARTVPIHAQLSSKIRTRSSQNRNHHHPQLLLPHLLDPIMLTTVCGKANANAMTKGSANEPRTCDISAKDFYTSYTNGTPNPTISTPSPLDNPPEPSPLVTASSRSAAFAMRRHSRRFSQKISGHDIGHVVQQLHALSGSSADSSLSIGSSTALSGGSSVSASPTADTIRCDPDVATSDYLTDEHDECGDLETRSSNGMFVFLRAVFCVCVFIFS